MVESKGDSDILFTLMENELNPKEIRNEEILLFYRSYLYNITFDLSKKG